jgi:hypothetical protein
MNHPPSIFFYCYPPTQRGDGSYHKAWHHYQHSVVVLAEGFQQFGIPCYSNINYWKIAPDREEYLLQYEPQIHPADCSIVIFNDHRCLFEPGKNGIFRKDIFNSRRSCITVYLDITDEDHRPIIFDAPFRQFDLILKAHYCSNAWYPANVQPWCFGLSQRILNELQTPPAFPDRRHTLLHNFRHTAHPHTLRKFIHERYIPQIQTLLPIDDAKEQPFDPLTTESDWSAYHLMQYAQSSARHYPAYYQRLQQATASACFGGFFTTPYPRSQAAFLSRNLRRIVTKLNRKTDRILQWDSWRFWESLAAGCVTIHVDFEKYGCALPVMPTNWQHYIGIDLDHMEQSIGRLRDEPDLLAKISQQGRQWALANYSPQPLALTFLAKTLPTAIPQLTQSATR